MSRVDWWFIAKTCGFSQSTSGSGSTCIFAPAAQRTGRDENSRASASDARELKSATTMAALIHHALHAAPRSHTAKECRNRSAFIARASYQFGEWDQPARRSGPGVEEGRPPRKARIFPGDGRGTSTGG